LTTVAVYAWAPRVVTAGWFAWISRREVDAAMDRLPGAALLADRLKGGVVWRGVEQGKAEEQEIRKSGNGGEGGVESLTERSEPGRVGPGGVGTSTGCVVVRWAGVDWVGDGDDVLDAGGVEGVAGDRAVLERLMALGVERLSGGVRVAVRGWEPPTLEVMDFVGELREAVGGGVVIEVAAGWVEGSGPTREAQAAAWGRAVDRLKDGDVRLVWVEVEESGVSDG